MPTVFIFHGIYGHPGENWFPWMKEELEKRGCEVVVPKFPTPENQNPTTWDEVMKPYEEKLNGAIIVGHSLGTPYALHVLETHSVAALCSVAGFCSLPENEFAPLMASFFEKEFYWNAIRRNCPSFIIFHSDNDPYVPFEKAEELLKQLHSEIIKVSGAGHFNAAAGYTTFPLLLEKVIEKI